MLVRIIPEFRGPDDFQATMDLDASASPSLIPEATAPTISMSTTNAQFFRSGSKT